MTRQDRRSPEAAAYRKLYATARWKRERLEGLRDEPLCRMCKQAGLVTPAVVRNHIVPHRGDLVLFWARGNLESLCEPHHNGAAQFKDNKGYDKGVDADGWPTDPMHPANR